MLEVKDYQTGSKQPAKSGQWEPTKHESQVIQELDENFSMAAAFRSNYEDQWRENIERYNAKPFFYEDGRAGIVLPIAKWIIESKQATEYKSPPKFSFKPLQHKEDKQIAKILEIIVKQHVWNLKYVDLDYKLDVLNHEKDILGSYYQYVGWRKIYRTIRKKGEPPEEDKDKNVDEDDDEVTQEMYYDDICVDNIPPQDVWLHPLARGVFDSPWIIIRKRFDYNKFLEAFSDTDFFKNVDKVTKGKWSLAQAGDVNKFKEFTTDDKDQVVVFEDWDIMKDRLTIRANGVIVFEGPNPFDHKELPFVDYIDRLQYDTYVGEGEPQRIATIADAINAFVNIAVDKEKRSASGINLMDDNASEFDDVSNLFSSNTATRVGDPKNAFVHFDIPGMSATTDRMIGMLMDYLIFATGVDFRQITDMNASTQATVAAIRREITQGRLNLNVRRNENRGFKRLGWLLMKNVQQFYPLPLIEKVSGVSQEKLEGVENPGEGAELPEGQGGTQETPAMPAAKPTYRSIRVPGMAISEKPDSAGNFKTDSLRVQKSDDNDEMGFFEARPAYIRTKGDIEVQVVSESTFAASKELEKANAKDYVGVAQTAVKINPETGQPEPILSLDYGLEMLVEAFGYDTERAFNTENDTEDNTAREEAEKLLGQNVGQNQAPGTPTQTTPPAGGGMPPEPPPARLTGTQSEPIRELKAQLGAANNVTK